MAVRLATTADRPAIVVLYNASPLVALYGTMVTMGARFLLADAFILVNDNAGVITACAICHADDSAREKAVCVNNVFGALAGIRNVLRVVAQQSRTRGYGLIYGYVSLHPALQTFRNYADRWPFHDVGDTRCYTPTPDQMETLA